MEFSGCNADILNDLVIIENEMVRAATISGATVINSCFHHFSPFGVSGVVIIEESHLAIHTWPEYQYTAVDLFTCGLIVDPWTSFNHLKKIFQSKNYSVIELRRGSISLFENIPFNVEDMRKSAQKHNKQDVTPRSVWFTDKDENQALSLRCSAKSLYDKSSKYQRVRVIDTYGYGKALTIDNMIMCTEKDEAHYHEMISHPVILAHKQVSNVLVVGGGDGGTVREVLKHKNIEKIVLVEIDENVIEASKQYMPSLSASFNNPKVELIIDDGIDYLKNSPDEIYDLILVDGSDPVGPAEGLFSTAFYQNCIRALKTNGLLVTQSGSPMFNRDIFIELNECLKNIFGKSKVKTLLFNTPTYPTGIWSFQIASKGSVNPESVDPEDIAQFEKNNTLHYYNYDMHHSAFSLPNYVKNIINE